MYRQQGLKKSPAVDDFFLDFFFAGVQARLCNKGCLPN